MKGNKREKKLVVKDGITVDRKKIINVLESFHGCTNVNFVENLFYRDSYYDDEKKTLLKEGGSLKLRIGTRSILSANKSIVMRRRTTDPKKMKISIWDEVEVEAYPSNDLTEILSPMKPFFPSFDFSKIVREPVLICSTSRTVYYLSKDDTVIAKMYLDSIKYESGNQRASDEIIKFRIISEMNYGELYEYLLSNLPEYYMIEESRYERALERLKKVF